MKGEEIKEKVDKTHKYSRKSLPKFLKFLGKIDELDQYEEWIKQVSRSLFDWFFEYMILKPFLIFICLSATGFSFFPHPPPDVVSIFLLAEGISITWFLFVELKKDLWRK